MSDNMSIRLSNLLPEIFEPKKPKPSEQPERRDKAAAIVTFIRKHVGRTAISRWEFSRSGTVILYFGVIHHDPNMRGQTIARMLAASEKFNFQFRLFADGNKIGMEILNNI
jgi:hypothetical protein